MLYIVKQLIINVAVLLLTLCVTSSSTYDIEILREHWLHKGDSITVRVISNNPAKSCHLALRNSTLVPMTKNGQEFTTNSKIDNQCNWNLATVKCVMSNGSPMDEKTIRIIKHYATNTNIVMNRTIMNIKEWRNITFKLDEVSPYPYEISCTVTTGKDYEHLKNLSEINSTDRCGNFNITKVFTFQAWKNMQGGFIFCRSHGRGFEHSYGDIPLIIWKARNSLHVKNNPSIEGMSVTVVVTSEVGYPSAEHTCTLRGRDGDKTLTGKSFGNSDKMITSTEFIFTAHEKYSEIKCDIKQGNFSHFAETLKESFTVYSLSTENNPSKSHRLIDENKNSVQKNGEHLFSLLTGLIVINIVFGVILVLLVGLFLYKKILTVQLSKEKKEEKLTFKDLIETENNYVDNE